MRTPWPKHFPPVFVHTDWKDPSGRRCLGNHELYEPAKNKRDVEAALKVIRDLARDDVLDQLVDVIRDHPNPVIVAPSAAPDESGNALGLAYAAWLARELGYDRCDTIYQSRKVKRDLHNGWYRLAHPTSFFGAVPEGRKFIIADDVCTMGGTLAETRAFIEANGGTVVATTTLAAKDGQNVQLTLSQRTQFGLAKEFGTELDEFWKEEFGYATDCLTEREAGLLLGHGPGVERIREGIRRARNGGTVRGD